MITKKDAIMWLNHMYISDITINKLENHFLEIEKVLYSTPKQLEDLGFLKKEHIEKILDSDRFERIKKLNDIYFNLGVDVIIEDDKHYPDKLRLIEISPKILYAKGDIELLNSQSIAIVGSRKCTSYGVEMCEYFTKNLVNNNIVIVSGFAQGIDTFAHKFSIEHGGKTIAVLGTGINIIYPKKNQNLYDKIVENGVIMTEFPLNTKGQSYNFPRRNRIISALSEGVLVVEAKEKSGSLITAGYAAEQGKEIYAVPGNINSVYSKGTNLLIKDGAKIVTSIEDILDDLEFITIKKNLKKDIYLTEIQKQLYDLLDVETSIDMLTNKVNYSANEIQIALSELELYDMVYETRPGLFLKKVME